ncbi:zinc finger protein 431-like [Armigeres subalbatus]|uniref:zinc finger protein 431-like n=1 Tax=Armigeres subalbatus TaxID=124917 RepID=UPI002ECFBEF9
MKCIVPTCCVVVDSCRRFPQQSILAARWLDSIRKGCGAEVEMDLDETNDCHVCIWHFETPGISPEIYEDENQYLEPRKFFNCEGEQIETDCCRLCLQFFRCTDMVDTKGNIHEVEINAMIFETLEIDLGADYIPNSICIECLARLDLMNSIRNDFLNVEIMFQHLMKTVQESRTDVVGDRLEHIKEENTDGWNLPEHGKDGSDYQEKEPKKEDDLDGRAEADVVKVPVPRKKGRTRTHRNDWLGNVLRKNAEKKCYICSAEFEDKFTLGVHLTDNHTSTSNHRCEECALEFATLLRYNRHLGRHDKNLPFKCSVCPLRFFSKMTVSHHEKVVHTSQKKCNKLLRIEKSYVCEQCGKSYIGKCSFNAHLNAHADLKVTCRICQATFTRNCSLERHMLIHAGTKPYSCDQCDKSFKRAFLLREHKQKAHNANDPFVCSICNNEYDTYADMYYHKKVIHHGKSRPKGNTAKQNKPDGITCKLCSISVCKKDLKLHISEVHPNEHYPFRQCPECPRTFLTYIAWYVHRKGHTDKYACKVCGRRFTGITSLQSHMTGSHSDGTRFECKKCPGKAFKTAQTLLAHERVVHLKTRQMKCEICDKTFNRKDNLDTHRRIHTGEKPYECSNCYMRFADQSTIFKHRKRCIQKTSPTTDIENVG